MNTPNLPDIRHICYKICIICEGDEETKYLERLKALGVWNKQYEITVDNAQGNGNLSAKYQDCYQNDTYDIVFIFCDTEKTPCKQYRAIKEKVNAFHGTEVASEVVIYGNPCTMQIIIQHLENTSLTSPAKKTNAALIKKLTGIEHYDAHAEQIMQLMQHITKENYNIMVNRLKKMSTDDSKPGSSNFSKIIDYLSCDNPTWITHINQKLETE